MSDELRDHEYVFPTRGTAENLVKLQPDGVLIGRKRPNRQVSSPTVLTRDDFPEFFDFSYDSFDTKKTQTGKSAIAEYRQGDRTVARVIVSPVMLQNSYSITRKDYVTFSVPVGYHKGHSVWFAEKHSYHPGAMTPKKKEERKLAFFEIGSGKPTYVRLESELGKEVNRFCLGPAGFEIFLDDGSIESYRLVTDSEKPSVVRQEIEMVQDSL